MTTIQNTTKLETRHHLFLMDIFEKWENQLTDLEPIAVPSYYQTGDTEIIMRYFDNSMDPRMIEIQDFFVHNFEEPDTLTI